MPVPPLPGVVTLIVTNVPAHRDATFTPAALAITGATGCATTVQLTLLLDDVVQPVPVDVLLDSIVLVPVTAAKLGTVVLHDVKPEPSLYLYSSVDVPVPPVPAVTVTVNICPAHTVALLGLFVIPGADG